jgi:hypothetical protein
MFLGCFPDSNTQVLPLVAKNQTIAQCSQLAKAYNSPFYGMRNWQSGSQFADCFYVNKATSLEIVTQFGFSKSCQQSSDAYFYGLQAANALYSTGLNLPNMDIPADLEHKGCFKDSSTRALPNYGGILTVSDCYRLARKAGSPFMGMQNWRGSGLLYTMAECWYGNADTTFIDATRYGPAVGCGKGVDGNFYGNGLMNSIYSTGLEPKKKVTTLPKGVCHLGCYKDKSIRLLQRYGGILTARECYQLAVSAGSPFFGMQFWQATGKLGYTAHCWYGYSSTTLTSATNYGKTSGCSAGADGNFLGGIWANSVYSTSLDCA